MGMELFDAYPLEEESDEELAESSDDEAVDAILHRAISQNQRSKRCMENESSSDDEFEKEMAAELDAKMKRIEDDRVKAIKKKKSCDGRKTDEHNRKEEYFDSDDDMSEDEKSTKTIPTNDELFYDPKMDDDDQRWVDSQRRKYQPVQPTSKSSKQPDGLKPLPLSDAVLNCPCCMSQLCTDCQRHATYKHQYRAMFVTNCTVHFDEVLRYPNVIAKTSKKHKSKKQRGLAEVESELDGNGASETDETYHPVVCSECNSEVGVYDRDEVYHFFNVLASHS